MFENEVLTLYPVHFFALSCDCRSIIKNDEYPSLSHHLLPSIEDLTDEEQFSKIAIGWNEGGIGLQVQVDQPLSQSFYPNIEKGDSVELFIDTRDLKTTGFNTRFCHHFFFLPQSIDGISKGEKTHFRNEDSHPLCDPEVLRCQVQNKKNCYLMKIFVPSQCLYGYDPKQFDRLGFTYRINRFGETPQHYSVVSQEYQIDQQPSLWGSLKLVK